MGDFNRQIGDGKVEESPNVGNYGYGKRDKRGWELITFCQKHEMEIVNSNFKKCRRKLWTWLAPNQQFKSQIDFILIKNSYNSTIDCIVSNFNFHSDHKLLLCELAIMNKKKHNNKTTNYKIDRLVSTTYVLY